jgi:hypothetical protein
MLGISLVAEQLLASQEGLTSTELVSLVLSVLNLNLNDSIVFQERDSNLDVHCILLYHLKDSA